MAATALQITAVDVPGGGTLGLTHCPGRCGGGFGTRDLAADLAAIDSWGATLLISLVESHEFARLGVPGFADAAQRYSFAWAHVPISDFGTPGAETLEVWRKIVPNVIAALGRNERVVLHCAAGLGRTGMIAAKILSDRGMPVESAIAHIRARRPGSIETAEQSAFVRNGPRLL